MSKANKRNVFAELMEGVDAMHQRCEARSRCAPTKWEVRKTELAPGAEYFVAVREKFNVSRAVWADTLRVSPRTVEKWEQGGQVSPLAATFVELVEQYPDTIERLQTLPKRIPRRTKASRGQSRRAQPLAAATPDKDRAAARRPRA